MSFSALLCVHTATAFEGFARCAEAYSMILHSQSTACRLQCSLPDTKWPRAVVTVTVISLHFLICFAYIHYARGTREGVYLACVLPPPLGLRRFS